jgi:hypothetical protein
MCHGYMITRFKPPLTTVLFSHVTHSLLTSLWLYFQIVGISVMSNYQNHLSAASSQRLLVPHEVSMVAGLNSQCPPGQVPCPLRALRGVWGQGFSGLMYTRAVSLLVSAELLTGRKEVQLSSV